MGEGLLNNYILIIMHEYNEKININQQINESKGSNNIFKERPFEILFLSLSIITFIIGFTVVYLKETGNKSVYSIFIFLIGFIFFLMFMKITELSEQKRYSKYKNIYKIKQDILRKILIESGLYESKKIDKLVEECNKLSLIYEYTEKIFVPIKNIIKSVYLPIIAFVAGIIVKNIRISPSDIMIILKMTLEVLILITGIYIIIFEVKMFLQDMFDTKSTNLKVLSKMLNDINIIDFI